MWGGVEDVREWLCNDYDDESFVTDKTGVKTVEIVGASFVADEDEIFGVANDGWYDRELAWYMSMSLNITDMEAPIPDLWKKAATPSGEINSNYGWVMFHEDNGHQYRHVLQELVANPDSRRAVAIYNRPTMHEDYRRDGMSDFMCTNAVQYLLRKNLVNELFLDTVVQMRSNDAVLGYRGDLFWQKYVRDTLVKDLNGLRPDFSCSPGPIFWQVGSLHVYERHFWAIDAWMKFGRNMRRSEYDKLVSK